MNKPEKTWTPARVETLRALVAEGKSFGTIALEMGLPRNAVAGKAHRLGIEGSGGSATVAGKGFRAIRVLDIDAEAKRRGISPTTLKRELITMGAEVYREEYENSGSVL